MRSERANNAKIRAEILQFGRMINFSIINLPFESFKIETLEMVNLQFTPWLTCLIFCVCTITFLERFLSLRHARWLSFITLLNHFIFKEK